MKILKRGLALLTASVLCLGMLTGCAEEAEEEQRGFPLTVSVGAAPVSLDPIYAELPGDQTILAHLYENLMTVGTDSSTGETTVANGMAKSVDQEQQHDGSVVYTFKLRGSEWSDGKPVTAGDFVYAWQRLANPASQSPYAALLSVVSGYQEARTSGDMSKLQVIAKNDNTLVVRLDGRYDWFLKEVCTSPATMPLRKDVIGKLKKQNEAEKAGDSWWSDPAKLVTNGPLTVTDWEPEEQLTMETSTHYHGSKTGPSTLTFRFAETAEDGWELYRAGEVDAVWPLTEEQLEKLSKKEHWKAAPELGTATVLFNYQREELADPQVRQAMSMVIDQTKLAELAGVTAEPAEGLVPPGVPESADGDFRTVGGPLLEYDPDKYAEQCEQARELMEESGYGQGTSLGAMEYLYVDCDNQAAVAEALCGMWKDILGIQVTARGVTEHELWEALRSGSFQLAGVDLTYPGNDAECVLMQWTSDSYDNLVHYENSAYDTLMAIIATAESDMARMGCLHDAEKLLLSEHVVVPLYTKGTGWMMKKDFSGIIRDSRGWFSFTHVFEKNG